MFANHVISNSLEDLQVIDHGFSAGCGVNAIWPETLIQGAKLEYEFTVQEGPLDFVVTFDNHTPRDCPEADVALHNIIAKFDSHVVKSRRVWRP
jgi:hypothetical protein